MAELVEPLDRALRSTRVLVRQCAVAAYRRQADPALVRRCSPPSSRPRSRWSPIELDADRMAVAAQPALLAVGDGHRRGRARPTTCPSEVVLAQIRSVVADLLLLTGMDPFEATDALPPVRRD